MTKAKKGASESFERVYKEVGQRLRWLRQRKGWSSADLGRACDYHPATLAAYESALSRVGIAEVVLICHALGVPPGLVLDGLDPESCRVPEDVKARRHEQARKRVEIMKKNGTLARSRKKREESNGQ